ncbi:hypothetical protein G4X40_03640 [Rhodococcus sp. D2-41]|uniref:Uncharacterized protein n=1 Tax=Speluncibacter jeojiensis TaxID=2710754 RepID=A0A9X4M2N6_9ACTN|nr:hypothetical protein [Rhodococcus sp. D2-41]MDG3009235.1 hypothetical protein [Rhodococcus sp. D2-41]MDG3016091.1 hypothetical protein [Corynebacteriales bacterium D3-21]
MKRGHTMVSIAAVAAASALTLTACGGNTDAGTAKAASTNAAAADSNAAAGAKLDTGTYPTTPQPAFGKAGTAQKGAIVEGQRLAEYVVHPWDIDINLTKNSPGGSYVIKNAAAAAKFLTKPVADSIANDQFVTGFATAAGDGDTVGHENVHAVLRFADPASAQKAANDLHQASITTDLNTAFGGTADPNTPPNTGTADSISALPNTLVVTHDSLGSYTVEAATPHGAYVIYDWFKGKDGSSTANTKAWAAKSAATAVQLQGPLIDKFPATPVDQLPNLPIDQDGVLRLTIPPASGKVSVNQNAVYGPNGFLNFSDSPLQDKVLLQSSGTDRVAFGDSSVYRTRDAQGAKVLLDGIAKQFNQSLHPAPAAPGVPGSQCWVTSSRYQSQTLCLVARGRYVAQVQGSADVPLDAGATAPTTAPAQAAGSDITMAHQKSAAQFEILAGQK